MPEAEPAAGKGYLALSPAPGPGLILLHEWWGLNAHIRSVADRFAAAGITTLAPDLYGGRTAPLSDPAAARTLIQSLTPEGVESVLTAAAQRLSPRGIGVLGFCMGGRLALYAGIKTPGIAAVVDFYGGANPPFPLDLAAMRAPVLALFGGKDRSIPPAAIAALSEGLKAARKHIDVAVYPEADHAFFNDTRPDVYDPAAAEDAFERSVAFLKRFLAR